MSRTVTTDDALAALAALLNAGQTPREALGLLAKVGGGASAFAAPILAALDGAGAEALGLALLSSGAVSVAEATLVGGLPSLSRPEGITRLSALRQRQQSRRRALLSLLWWPALWTGLTFAMLRLFRGFMGQALGGLAGDLAPMLGLFGLLGVVIGFGPWLASRLSPFKLYQTLTGLDRQGELAEALSLVQGEGRSPAEQLELGASLLRDSALKSAVRYGARRMAQGTPSAVALPSATVGDALTLALAVGQVTGEGAHTLKALAERCFERTTRRLRLLMRLAGLFVLIWISLRSSSALTDLGSQLPGLGGLGGLPGLGDPASNPDLQELMKELE